MYQYRRNSKDAKKQISQRTKLILFSTIFYGLLLIISSITFSLLMEKNLISYTGNKHSREIMYEQISLEVAVNKEIAVTAAMASSPLIQRYFQNPNDREFQKYALSELEAYRQSFSSKTIFWINDKNKVFHFTDREPYVIDPNCQTNYWYDLTLYEKRNNVNVNFNPDLNRMDVWINAAVLDDNDAPIGMLGGAIILKDFIDSFYNRFPADARLFMTNSSGEITVSRDITDIEKKIRLDEKLGSIGSKILKRVQDNKFGSVEYIRLESEKGIAVIGYVPALDWYVVSVQNLTTRDILTTSLALLYFLLMFVLLLILVIFNLYADRLINESERAKKIAETVIETIEASINYASKIQHNLLPCQSVLEKAFSDFSVIWKPRDIVGGDIYWAKNYSDGTVLCVCDCTGHGTPGALLTMLVVSTLESVVTDKRYKNTAEIIYNLDQKLATVLNVDNVNNNGMDINDGCDIAVLFIGNDGIVSLSAGNIDVFVCDGNEVTRYKGQTIFVGEGRLTSPDDVITTIIPHNADNKFYITSDGTPDQIGGEKSKQFGLDTLKRIILENHQDCQAVISEKLWEAFEQHRGTEERRDDIELISFKI
jgi:serine phosphatase RsbU (regulator of sigma subunit)